MIINYAVECGDVTRNLSSNYIYNISVYIKKRDN